MDYVRFGNTGMLVSRFSLGAMTFVNKLSEKDSACIVDEALDAGVNVIDTADSYRRSEEVLGNILGEKRERVFLATKVFKRYCRNGNLGRNSRVNITNSLHRSLRLLQTDYVDLYQLHHPDDKTPIEETLSTLDNFVKQGKIRYIGVSNHYAWQMAAMIGESKVHHWEPLISAQENYDILDRQIELETVPFCQRFNIAIMCYGPLCGGILTGKYNDPEHLPDGSRGEKSRIIQHYLKDTVVQKVLGELRGISDETGLAMNQLAMLWLKAKPWATTILLGGSKAEHFRDIYAIQDEALDGAVIERIDQLSEPRMYTRFKNQPVRAGAELSLEW